MNGEGLILPVPQLSMLCQSSPILGLLVGLIQRHSYTDCNYTDVNETLCWFGANNLMPEQCRIHCSGTEIQLTSPTKKQSNDEEGRTGENKLILVFCFKLSSDYLEFRRKNMP